MREGALFENLGVLRKTRLLDEEMLEYYAEEYRRNGMGGTGEFYRIVLSGPAALFFCFVLKCRNTREAYWWEYSMLVSEQGGQFQG